MTSDRFAFKFLRRSLDRDYSVNIVSPVLLLAFLPSVFIFVIIIRSRGACDTYKQLIVDALSQLKALHKAGVMSNNQSNQFDRLVKAVEQVKSRPIWTPNTARQQQADLVEHLKKELNKVFVMMCCCS